MEEKKKLKLFYKFLCKQSNRKEYEEFINEFEEKDVHKNFDYLFEGYWDVIQSGKNISDSTENLSDEADKILQIVKRKERSGRYRDTGALYLVIAKVAAVVVVALAVYVLGYYANNKHQDKIAEDVKNIISTIEKKTKYGEMSNVLLSDGSNVTLNVGSEIRFNENFSGNTREVGLNGQAFFDVARNKNKPFIINTGNLQVTVLGTAFDVKSYNDDDFACITVIRGKVRVTSPKNEYTIVPNEQAFFQKSTGKLIKREVKSSDFIKWTNGTLYFDQTPVEEMVRRLERWYNVKIQVNDPDILSRTVTGEYINESLVSVLKTLEFSLNIKYEFNEKVVTLKKTSQ